MEKIYKKDINKIMPILQALAEGKTIQINEGAVWKDIDIDGKGIDISTLIECPECYRVKQEPKYRSFKDAEECWHEMLKHQPFGVVKDKYFANYQIHRAFTCLITNGCDFGEFEDETFESCFKNLLFADGTPFGVKDE